MDWNQHYLDNHTPWDKGAPAPPLLEWMEANPGEITGRVLVPGSGSGYDCRAIAEHSDADEVLGIDISPEAVKRSRTPDPIGTERFEIADLFALRSEYRNAFDWVWEHTCFCAISPDLRDDYVEAVHSTLKRDGTLLAVFFLDPYDDEHAPGGGPPHGSTLEELEHRFVRSGRFRELESYVPEKAYEGREGLERVVRYRKLG